MGGGTFTMTATPGAIVNQAGAAEQNGVFYLGIDGTGVFVQTGGVARAHGIVLDGRGETGGNDTFIINGGRFNIGPSGFKSGTLDANTSYIIALGGGVIGSSANWTSVLKMTITGTNGNTTFDTGSNSNLLTGALSGPGGITKTGSGALTLTGVANYQGGTIVNQGTFVVRGSLGLAAAQVVVQGGTLMGDGTISDSVDIQSGGTLSPGLSIGKLTINNNLSLGGNTVMEISKAGATLSADLVAVASSLTYGGTLTVVATGSPLAEGDTFNLFDAGSFGGSFATVNLPTLPTTPAGLFWDVSQLAVDGTILVSRPRPSLTIATTPDGIDLSWGEGFSDYTIQFQTNAPGVGITTNWVTLPNPNTNRVIFPIDTNWGSVFYRLLR
jgi:autotransporter-associated beta strand protein